MSICNEEIPRNIIRVIIETETSSANVTEDITDGTDTTLASMMDLIERALLGLGWPPEVIRRAFAEWGEEPPITQRVAS